MDIHRPKVYGIEKDDNKIRDHLYQHGYVAIYLDSKYAKIIKRTLKHG